jgi:hypothetical protein
MLTVSGWSFLTPLTVTAANYTLEHPTVSGSWPYTPPEGFWLSNGISTTTAPGTSDNVSLGNGSDLVTITINFNNDVPTLNTLEIKNNATLSIFQGGRFIINNGLTNTGLLLFSGNREVQLNNNSVNSGTILVTGQNVQGSLTSGTLTNTGGLLSVQNGGTLNFRMSGGIVSGTLLVGANSVLTHSDIQTSSNGAPMVMNGVTIVNAGHYDWFQTLNNNSRGKPLALQDGSFTNSGTLSIRQLGIGDTTANIGRSLSISTTGTNQFTNSGQINVLANTADQASNNQFALLDVNVSGDGFFHNNGLLTIQNNSTGDTGGSTYFQYAKVAVTSADKFTNSGTITISLDAATTDDAQHYATLTVADDWTNAGTVLIDRADKTAAQAALDLGTNNYTAAAGSLTQLANGGQIIAGAVNLSGTIAGAGEIQGAAIVSAGGVLAPSGTLTLSDGLTVSGGTLDFDGAANSFLSINGDVDFTGGGTLNVSNIDLTGGDYWLADYTGDLSGTLTVSGLDDAFLDFATDGKIYLTIPEPSALALMVTGAALLLMLRHRRRR